MISCACFSYLKSSIKREKNRELSIYAFLFQASDEVRDSGNFVGGTDINLNLGPKDPDREDEGDTGEQHEVRTEHRLKRKSVTPDLEMRM